MNSSMIRYDSLPLNSCNLMTVQELTHPRLDKTDWDPFDRNKLRLHLCSQSNFGLDIRNRS